MGSGGKRVRIFAGSRGALAWASSLPGLPPHRRWAYLPLVEVGVDALLDEVGDVGAFRRLRIVGHGGSGRLLRCGNGYFGRFRRYHSASVKPASSACDAGLDSASSTSRRPRPRCTWGRCTSSRCRPGNAPPISTACAATSPAACTSSPVFTRRLATLPFDLASPVWVEDREVDLDHHIRRIEAAEARHDGPARGAGREAARAASRPRAPALDVLRHRGPRVGGGGVVLEGPPRRARRRGGRAARRGAARRFARGREGPAAPGARAGGDARASATSCRRGHREERRANTPSSCAPCPMWPAW